MFRVTQTPLIGSLTSIYLLKYTLATCFGYVKLSLGSVQYVRTQTTTGWNMSFTNIQFFFQIETSYL